MITLEVTSPQLVATSAPQPMLVFDGEIGPRGPKGDIGDQGPQGEQGVADLLTLLTMWALSGAFRIVSAIRNSDGAVSTASIVWPDGTAGMYTADAFSQAFQGATDAWHATYEADPVITVTQPAVSRDGDGAVTAQPAVILS